MAKNVIKLNKSCLLNVCLQIHHGPAKMLHLIIYFFGPYEMHWPVPLCFHVQLSLTAILGHANSVLRVLTSSLVDFHSHFNSLHSWDITFERTCLFMLVPLWGRNTPAMCS